MISSFSLGTRHRVWVLLQKLPIYQVLTRLFSQVTDSMLKTLSGCFLSLCSTMCVCILQMAYYTIMLHLKENSQVKCLYLISFLCG